MPVIYERFGSRLEADPLRGAYGRGDASDGRLGLSIVGLRIAGEPVPLELAIESKSDLPCGKVGEMRLMIDDADDLREMYGRGEGLS